MMEGLRPPDAVAGADASQTPLSTPARQRPPSSRGMRTATPVQRTARSTTPRTPPGSRFSQRSSPPRRSPRLHTTRQFSSRIHAEPPPERIHQPRVTFKIWRPHKPERWQFILLVPHEYSAHLPATELTSKDAESAYCTRCSCKVTYSHGSTTAVKVHMEKYHMEVLLKAKQDQAQAKARSAKRQLENAYDQIPEAARRKLTSISKDQQSYANGLLAKWVAQSMRPLSIVEDPGLLEFIRYATEVLGGVIVEIPGSTQLRADISRIAAELRASLKARVQSSCLYYCITTDIWTSRRAQSYMALTLHYVDEAFTMCSWTLEVEAFPGMHTGVAIARGLEEMMDRWELRPERCMLLVRDGAANAVLGSDILGIKNMSCIAHSLHLVLGGALARHKVTAALVPPADAVSRGDQDADDRLEFVAAQAPDDREVEQASDLEQEAAITELESFVGSSLAITGHRLALAQVRGIVHRFRSLATYFHKSAKATNRLDEIQTKEWKITSLHLITDCPTRWNSCRDMLARLIELEAPLDSFLTYLETTEGKKEFKDLDQEKFPKPNEWFAIKCLVALLDPIAAVTKVLGGCYYPTLALAFPMLRRIKKVLGDPAIFSKQAALVGRQEFQADVLHMMHQARDAILELFKQRFTGMDFDVVWISFLDPRFHKMKLLNQDEIDLARQCLLDAAATSAGNSPGLSSTSGLDLTISPSHRSPSDDTQSVWDDLLGSDSEDESSSASHDPNFQSVRLKCSNEFVVYLEAAKSVPKKQDPLVWWSVNGHIYPSLALLARKWLGCVATSVPSERAFSTAGNTVTAKRCQMDVSLVRDLVFIAENYAGPKKE